MDFLQHISSHPNASLILTKDRSRANVVWGKKAGDLSAFIQFAVPGLACGQFMPHDCRLIRI
jgi:hypothetical protein